MKRSTRALILLLAAAIVAIGILTWGDLPFTGGANPSQPDKPPLTTEPSTLPPPPPPSEVIFMAVGDNLIHKPIYNQAKARAKDGADYDFAPAYAGVRWLLARADLSMINQETPIATAVAPVSSYPMFCSPPEVGDAIYSLGFRAIQVINNHTLDKREAGVLAHLDYWDSWGDVCHFGAYRDSAESMEPRTLTVNGITFGFVGATFSYNGLVLPQGSPLVLPRLEQEELLRLQIGIARDHADVVVVSPHWGTEDSTRVNDQQRELARKFIDWGADMVIGNHPHVLQHMEFLDKLGGGQAFVAYSLGNFLSGQNAAPNLVGGVLELTITKDNTSGRVTIEQPRFHPVITQYEAGFSNIRLIPWSEYTPELGNRHGVRSKDSRFGYSYIERLLREIVPEGILVMDG